MPRRLIALFVASVSCAASTWEVPPLPESNRILVQVNNTDVAEIRDPDRIRAISEFVNAKRDGWDRPWYGIPVADTRVAFYRDKSILGYFGVGWVACRRDRGFFETLRFEPQLPSGRGSRTASLRECEDFIGLLGLPHDQLAQPR